MIKVLKSGKYQLVETSQQIKVLYLDETPYIWLYIPGIGHVIEMTHNPHRAEHILAQGSYRIYDVKGEERFSRHKHLELFIGDGAWQGYLILTDLPSETRKRVRIVATNEVVSALSGYPAYQ